MVGGRYDRKDIGALPGYASKICHFMVEVTSSPVPPKGKTRCTKKNMSGVHGETRCSRCGKGFVVQPDPDITLTFVTQTSIALTFSDEFKQEILRNMPWNVSAATRNCM